MFSAKNLAAAALYPLIYLIGCAALAALAAYPIFILGDADNISFFRTLVSRGGQVFMILGLYPLSKYLGLTASSLGFRRSLLRQMGIGFALGVLMLSLHVLALLALDIRALNGDGLPGGGRLLSILAKALGTGIAVALMEETIFRGVLFGAVRKFSGPLAAVVISAFYYAALHFIGSRWTTELSAVGWDTGFRIAADGFAHLATITPDNFLALFLAGALLACVRVAVPGGLGYCMGLHAGWVFVIKAAKPLTHVVPDAPWSFLVGSYDRFIGYFSSAWIGILIMAFLIAARHGIASARENPGNWPRRLGFRERT